MSERKPRQNGKGVSTTAAPPSPDDVPRPSADLQRLLARTYDAFQKLDDPKLNADCRRDFVFHMTDWINDLKKLDQLYASPEGMKTKDAQSAVYGFLVHAVPHLMAAARLLEGRDITHPFKFPWEKGYP